MTIDRPQMRRLVSRFFYCCQRCRNSCDFGGTFLLLSVLRLDAALAKCGSAAADIGGGEVADDDGGGLQSTTTAWRRLRSSRNNDEK